MNRLTPALLPMAATSFADGPGPLLGLAVNVPAGGTEKDLVQGMQVPLPLTSANNT